MPRARPLLALTVLILIALACGSPTQNATPSPAAPAAPTPSPTPTEAPLPFSLSDAVTTGIEDGRWTRAEGLTQLLRYMAGEVAVDQAFPDQAPASDEGTGVIRQAIAYLADPATVESRDEIQRLVNILVPTRETLDRFSRAAVAARGQPGLADPSRRPVGDEADCRALWADGFSGSEPIVCLEYTELVIGGNSYRIYYPAYWDAADPRRALLEPTANAVRDSVELYNTYGPEDVMPADIVFTELAYLDRDGRRTDDTLAVAVPGAGRSRCYVGVFPSALVEPDDLPFFLAHEMFHCYQYTNLSHQESGPPPEVNEWWVEGSANYFASVVYDTVNTEWGYVSWFDRRSPSLSLFDLNYDDYLFFEYLALQQGYQPEGVIDLLRLMPILGGRENQQDALAHIDGMQEIFHAFGQAYLDQDLQDTGGGEVPVDPRSGPVHVLTTGPANEEFEPEPFRLHRYRLAFADHNRFQVDSEAEGDGGLLHVRPAESAGGWGDPPQELSTACGETELTLLVTDAGWSDAAVPHFTLHINGEELEPDAECDRCLIGAWEMDLDSYRAAFDVLSSTYFPGGATLNDVEGSIRSDFSETGFVHSTTENFVAQATFTMGGRPASVTFRLNGSTDAAYVVEGEGRIHFSSMVEALVSEYQVSVRGLTIDVPGITLPTPGLLSGEYTCTEDRLHLTPVDVGVDHPGVDLVRVH